MSAILKFDFQKTEQLGFSEVNYLNYTKKGPILHVATTFSLKKGNKNKSWTHSTPLKHLNLPRNTSRNKNPVKNIDGFVLINIALLPSGFVEITFYSLIHLD